MFQTGFLSRKSITVWYSKALIPAAKALAPTRAPLDLGAGTLQLLLNLETSLEARLLGLGSGVGLGFRVWGLLFWALGFRV